MTKQTANGATEAQKLVEVRLLRHYVPQNGEFYISADDIYAGTPKETRLNVKVPAGTVISLPRDEAKWAISEGIAQITADLI